MDGRRKVFTTEDELVAWFADDIAIQKKVLARSVNPIFILDKQAHPKLILRLEPTDLYDQYVVDFHFDLSNIIRRLFNNLKSDVDYLYLDVPISFFYVSFNKLFSCSRVCLTNETYLHVCFFKSDVVFLRTGFENLFTITKSEFYAPVKFKFCHSRVNAKTESCIGNNVMNLIQNIFEKEVDFSSSLFDLGANLEKNIFRGLVDFSLCIFGGVLEVNDSFFYSNVLFDKVVGSANLQFHNITCKPDGLISFSEISNEFRSNNMRPSYVYTSSNKINISITNSLIEGRIDFRDVDIEKFDFAGSKVVDGGFMNKINFNFTCDNWETATFLKHQEIEDDNIIGSLKYKGIEKDLYKVYIKSRRKDLKQLIKDARKTDKLNYKKLKVEKKRIFWESVAIWLSKTSNDHAQNWWQAVVFTIISGLIFFLIPYAPNLLCAYCRNEIDFAYEFFRFFIPIDYSAITGEDKILHPAFLLAYISGKILISYGYVEVVQAFRKLK